MSTLLLVITLIAVPLPPQRYAGYDPKRDPAKDLETAVVQAAKENKRILLVVGGEWCGWCHTLENFIKTNEDVQKTWAASYITIKVNWSPENHNESFLKSYPPVNEYPHLFVVEKDGRLLHSQNPAQFEVGSTYSKEKILDFLHRWQPERR